jgi:hypothetical protein
MRLAERPKSTMALDSYVGLRLRAPAPMAHNQSVDFPEAP